MPTSDFSQNGVEREVIDVLVRLSPRPIKPTPASAVVADLGFDSIAVIELVGALEEHFDIAIPMNRLAEIKTVAQMAENIRTILGSKPS